MCSSPVMGASGARWLQHRLLRNGRRRSPLATADVGMPVSGVFVGGTRTTRQATLGGARAQFQVRAWEAACGGTYEEAMAAPAQGGRRALIGQSAILEVPTGNADPPTPPAVL